MPKEESSSYLVYTDLEWQAPERVTFCTNCETDGIKKLEVLMDKYREKFGSDCPLQNPIVIEIYLSGKEGSYFDREIFDAYNEYNSHKPKLSQIPKSSISPKLSTIAFSYNKIGILDHAPVLDWLKTGNITEKYLDIYVDFVNWYAGKNIYDKKGKFIYNDND